jgi:hypothetical protein
MLGGKRNLNADRHVGGTAMIPPTTLTSEILHGGLLQPWSSMASDAGEGEGGTVAATLVWPIRQKRNARVFEGEEKMMQYISPSY